MAKVVNIERLQARFAALPAAIRAAAMRAAEENADEFVSLITRTVPKGEDAGKGNERLVDTLQKGPSKLGFGVRVTIGGPEAPYPAHLEFGHMTKGGKHVPAKPFWYPARRILKKKQRDRISRRVRDAIRAMIAGAGQ